MALPPFSCPAFAEKPFINLNPSANLFLLFRSPKSQTSISVNYMPEIVSLPKCLCKCRNNSSPISSDDSPSTRVFIKGLSLSTTEGYLTNAFSQFGKVDRVKVVTDRASKQSLGFAYIWFTCEEDAKLAVKKMDGKGAGSR
ncbi:glycine-rich RNA-binding protein 4, mitochondrial-like isoform X2 [Amborella trichopoda]|uniref:glycine-rich RNA-binding protein 4, mitochondrial-like isoform X2 n=1 Tax=Amborella trichopoda TaxID=13333 RepID=UPI0009BF8075|nr:glycine-rich RNA-binding protein 4, mitochondrial-like isoform X2 [Amborella trichopoda]|eukprot:XP_020526831.1 glycine-rich RNA-binding protein 4, mitochondrial-like isoform X2 [Amborella trichopoda]